MIGFLLLCGGGGDAKSGAAGSAMPVNAALLPLSRRLEPEPELEEEAEEGL